jgi:ribulose-5-phosphate 4-epimerase/fuculose-1-phosphate aldolase
MTNTIETMTKGAPLGNTRAASDLMPPKFDSIETERKHRKQRLAAAFRLFAHFGYDEGLAGHITVRDPEHPDRFWVNPLGVHFAHITPADLVLVSHEGKVVEGQRPVNAAAFAIHSAIHKARPDVIAAAHAHSIYGRTWSAFGRLLDPITQDACAFYQDHAVFDHYTGVVHETSEGHQIAEALGAKKAAILKNHGLLTVGKSVDIAAWFFISMDRCCQSQLLAEMAGKPSTVPHEVAIKTRDFIASDLAAWASFQPLFQFITRKHPELLA